MPGGKILPIATVCVALACIGWGTWGRDKVGFAKQGGDGGTTDLRSLLDAQARQNERLDRLEMLVTGIANRMGGTAGARYSGVATAIEGNISPAQVEAANQRRWQQTQAAFDSEPVSKPWADKTQNLITNALSPDSLASKNSPTPRQFDALCRSTTCRIELVYPNQADADAGQLFLLSDIGGVLNSSHPFQRVLPDGSVQLVMYSTHQRPSN